MPHLLTTNVLHQRLSASLLGLIIGLLPCCLGCDATVAQTTGDDPVVDASQRAVREAASAIATDSEVWPGWLGPGGNGTILGGRLPDPWPKNAPQPAWEIKLGIGWSSPVADDSRVYVTDRQGGIERVLAFDAQSGQEVWSVTHPVDFDPHAVGRQHGNGPKSTPALNHGRLFALGIAGWLECIEAATGKRIWHVNLPERFGAIQSLPDERAIVNGTEDVIVPIGAGRGAPVPLFGYTGSPAVTDDLVIIEVGQERGGTVMAFQTATGEVAWKSLKENVSYSSPRVATIAGIPQVVAMTGPRVVGLDLADGRLLWSHPFQIQYDESISTPAVADDMVLVTADGKPLTALKIARDGENWQAKVAWTNRDLTSYLSSMVIRDGYVYGMNDGGEFACIRLADGKTAWIGGNRGYYCSPLVNGERLLGLTDEGELFVLSVRPDKYQLLATNQLVRGETWTVPAVVGSRLFIRGASRLTCYDYSR